MDHRSLAPLNLNFSRLHLCSAASAAFSLRLIRLISCFGVAVPCLAFFWKARSTLNSGLKFGPYTLSGRCRRRDL